MPANLTPQYLSAELRYRAAATDPEKLEALREMLQLIPKHKGTDKLQGDIKRRIAKLTQAAQQRSKGGSRRTGLHTVERQGGGQIVLAGAPNTGKSSIVAALTSAQTEVADYPFTTHRPIPGMMLFEDAQVQLVDMPPFAPEGAEPWMFTVLRQADVAALVVDLGSDDLLEDAQALLDAAAEHRIDLRPEFGHSEDVRGAWVKAFFLCTKADLDPDRERLEMFREFFGERLPVQVVSAATGEGMDGLPSFAFEFLQLIRVYTRQPGKKDRNDDPFVLKKGSTVIDLAKAVHQEFAAGLKFARIWGTGVYDGQNVKRGHVLSDKDVVELHG